MKSIVPAVRVGITFLLVCAMSYWAFMMVVKSGGCGGRPDQLKVHAFFRDATLLVEKSRVQISGLNVGSISARALDVHPPRPELVAQKRFAKISLELGRDVKIFSNATVFKRSASLLGEFYLEVDPGTPEWIDSEGNRHTNKLLRNGDEIRTVVEATTASGVVQQVGEMLPIMKDMLKDLRTFTSGPLLAIGEGLSESIAENREAIGAVVQNMEAISGDIRTITQGAGPEVSGILDDIKAITTSVRGMVGGPDDSADVGNKVRSGLGKLNEAVDKLDKVLADVHGITSGLNEGKGNLGRVLKDEELIDGVEEIVHDTGSLVKSITSLQTVVGLRSEYNFEAGSIKTYVTVELRPRPDKYYYIELIDDPRGKRDVSATIRRSDDPTQPLVTREDRVVLTDAFRVSFQFAKRIRFPVLDTTFRFGIKESTGGVGLDLHFLEDKFNVWTDVFDFQANVLPRLKVILAWQFFRRLYVVGGIDDILNERPLDGTGGGRDYFLGMQLRFNDEDLRQLLIFGGGALGAAAGGS